MLRNAVGGGSVSDFAEKSVTKIYGSTLLALRGWWVGVEFPEKNGYVTLEWLLTDLCWELDGLSKTKQAHGIYNACGCICEMLW